MSQAIAEADRLAGLGRMAEAVAALRSAAANGDALAARELAVWFLGGQLVPRDLSQARQAFGRAAELGDQPSRAVYRNFMAQGIGGPADWSAAVGLLKSAAADDPDAARQVELIAEMGDEAACSASGEILSPEPEVRLIRQFLSSAECEYLADAASPLLQPAYIVDPATGRQRPNPIRTSEAAAFAWIDESPLIHAINRRIATATGTDVRCGEPLQVLRYQPGQEYRLHNDALPGCPPAQQRVLTFLIWLNDAFKGGETDFPQLGLRLRGGKGDGLLFRSTTQSGAPDPRAIHAGLPVTAGAKLLASRWIRATPLAY